jgi:hypothetical protein
LFVHRAPDRKSDDLGKLTLANAIISIRPASSSHPQNMDGRKTILRKKACFFFVRGLAKEAPEGPHT